MTWTSWEDYEAGLYVTTIDVTLVEACRRLLSDEEQFREAASEMVRAWPAAAWHNLRNMESGRNAWLGQATCCYSLGVTAQTVRDAWGEMTLVAQRNANAVAVEVRERWEREVQDGQAVLGL